MKYFKLIMFCLMLITQAAHSQLTITPSAGFEAARTRVKINEGSFFKPLSNQLTPRIGLRFDYQIKNGHGVFAGVSTSNTGVEFNFSNPKEGIKNYSSSRSNTRLRIEGGYQFSSKFSGCSFSCKSKAKTNSAYPGAKKNNELLSMRFMEQFGLAYIPSVKNNFENNTGGVKENYTYKAGNWNFAFLIAWGFEISKGNTKKLNIGIQYLKGIGHLKNQLLNEAVTNAVFSSRTSSWSFTIGVPFAVCSNKGNH